MRTSLSSYIFATKARIDNRKKLVKQQYLTYMLLEYETTDNVFSGTLNPTHFTSYNMANFGLLAADIRWRVCGTPANFIGFRVLAALLHGSQVVDVSQTLRR